MTYTTFCMILAIGFWVLAALGIVCLMAWTYVQVQYYKWSKDDRDRELFKASLKDAIKDGFTEFMKAFKEYDPETAIEEQYEDLNDFEDEENNY